MTSLLRLLQSISKRFVIIWQILLLDRPSIMIQVMLFTRQLILAHASDTRPVPTMSIAFGHKLLMVSQIRHNFLFVLRIVTHTGCSISFLAGACIPSDLFFWLVTLRAIKRLILHGHVEFPCKLLSFKYVMIWHFRLDWAVSIIVTEFGCFCFLSVEVLFLAWHVVHFQLGVFV